MMRWASVVTRPQPTTPFAPPSCSPYWLLHWAITCLTCLVCTNLRTIHSHNHPLCLLSLCTTHPRTHALPCLRLFRDTLPPLLVLAPSTLESLLDPIRRPSLASQCTNFPCASYPGGSIIQACVVPVPCIRIHTHPHTAGMHLLLPFIVAHKTPCSSVMHTFISIHLRGRVPLLPRQLVAPIDKNQSCARIRSHTNSVCSLHLYRERHFDLISSSNCRRGISLLR
ncbi:hypothetical protein B0I35DRAFT_100455 [Stachybotrys elegans]|uniref:Uncharacterized protein n=1 Tax=Stachybotrys elegans TaxID=80388 RepID=A0A8K0WN31_9HYPO|nr:hypothetical protein B0I35DRAFT_100455 [Stachybotrys elegans]